MSSMSSNHYSGTSSSSGALLQLLACGAMDGYLCRGATRTFWKPAFARATQFSLESIPQAFQGTPTWGGESTCTIARSGDLLWKQFIRLTLPGLTTQKRDDTPNVSQPAFPSAECDGQKCADLSVYLNWVSDGYTAASDNTKQVMLDDGKRQWEAVRYGCAPAPVGFANSSLFDAPDFDACWWTEAVGFAAIKRLELKIGGSVCDVNWAELMFINEELCGHSGKKLTELIGRTFRSVDRLIEASRQQQILYIPTGFWFSSAPSLALPLAALAFHNVHLTCHWSPLSALIHKSMCDLLVLRSDTGMPLGDSDLQAAVENVFVHLGQDERDSVINAPQGSPACFDKNAQKFTAPDYMKANGKWANHEGGLMYLIYQHQGKRVPIQSANMEVPLGMSFAVSCLMFCIRRKSAKESNDTFNFSGIGGDRDPLLNAALAFNQTTRVSSHPAVWWRLVQPYMHMNSMPLSRIYSYSFALSPCVTTEPSGTANFSRLDSIILDVQLQEEFGSGSESEAELFIFCRNWNILRICSGMGSISFSS